MPPKRQEATIANRLREIIAARGLTAREVAEGSAVSPSIVSRFLARERGLTLESLDAIAGHLGLYLAEGRRPVAAVAKARPKRTPRPAKAPAE